MLPLFRICDCIRQLLHVPSVAIKLARHELRQELKRILREFCLYPILKHHVLTASDALPFAGPGASGDSPLGCAGDNTDPHCAFIWESADFYVENFETALAQKGRKYCPRELGVAQIINRASAEACWPRQFLRFGLTLTNSSSEKSGRLQQGRRGPSGSL